MNEEAQKTKEEKLMDDALKIADEILSKAVDPETAFIELLKGMGGKNENESNNGI